MKKIYPYFYTIIPVPKDDFMVFRCLKCEETWLGNIKQFSTNDTRCPYCGHEGNLNHFYETAYLDKVQYYHYESLKNLLELVGVKANIQKKEYGYDLDFISEKEPDDEALQVYLTKAYTILKKLAEENKLDFTSNIQINVEDVIDVSEFVLLKLNCCGNLMMVNSNKQDIKYCIYCK